MVQLKENNLALLTQYEEARQRLDQLEAENSGLACTRDELQVRRGGEGMGHAYGMSCRWGWGKGRCRRGEGGGRRHGQEMGQGQREGVASVHG